MTFVPQLRVEVLSDAFCSCHQPPGPAAALTGMTTTACNLEETMRMNHRMPRPVRSRPPFSLEWDTTAVADGSVSLTAHVTDAAGNVGTSAGVTVAVNNATPAVSLSRLQETIFTPKCSGCHTGIGSSLPGAQNLTAGNAFASIVGD